MSLILFIEIFPLAFLVHDVEEIVVQRKWMQKHRENLIMRFPRLQTVLRHLGSLSTKAFAIAVMEELLLLSLATVYVFMGGAYAMEIWAALFVAFSIHLVVHIAQGIIIRGYVPGIATSILLLPYAYFGISTLSQEMSWGKLTLLGVTGFILVVVNLFLAHWIGKRLGECFSTKETQK